jgi:ABC-2 type transport system ATP-binding protein
MDRITISNLTKRYKSKKALENVSLEILPSKISTIIGPNGAGKTTLLKIISGFDNNYEGKVNYGNLNIRDVSVSFGGESGFYNENSVLDNLRFFCRVEGIKSKDIPLRVENALNFVDLKKQENKKVGQLSLGMKQKLHLARALINNPSLLLLDEPTNGLDIQTSDELIKNIKKISSNGVFVIITSHNIGHLEKIADEFVLLNRGRKMYSGDKNGIIELSKIKNNNLEDACLALFKNWSKND